MKNHYFKSFFDENVLFLMIFRSGVEVWAEGSCDFPKIWKLRNFYNRTDWKLKSTSVTMGVAPDERKSRRRKCNLLVVGMLGTASMLLPAWHPHKHEFTVQNRIIKADKHHCSWNVKRDQRKCKNNIKRKNSENRPSSAEQEHENPSITPKLQNRLASHIFRKEQ